MRCEAVNIVKGDGGWLGKGGVMWGVTSWGARIKREAGRKWLVRRAVSRDFRAGLSKQAGEGRAGYL
jgi:hypothetical protein